MLTAVPLDVAAQLLADPLRARLVGLLTEEDMCTHHLVEETGARQATVSHHLRLLQDMGWVEIEPGGRFTYYRLRPEPLHALSDELATAADIATHAAGRRRPC